MNYARIGTLALLASLTIYQTSVPSSLRFVAEPPVTRDGVGEGRVDNADLLRRIIAQQDAADVTRVTQELRRVFKPGTQRLLELGRLDGDTPDVFGHITKLIPGSAGDFFVLDRQMFEIKWFSRDGQLRGKAGGQGSGPGEFRSPAALFFDSVQSVIHTWDRRNSRFSLFRPENSGLRHLRDIRVDASVDEFCVMNGVYYILNGYDSLTVRGMTLDGKIVGSFAARLEVSHLLGAKLPEQLRVSFRAGYNRAAMYCEPRRQIIVLSHTQIPLVRAFTTRGDLIWSTELKDFHQLRWTPVPGSGAYQQAPDPKSKTVTFVSAAFLVAPNILGLTLADGGLLRGGTITREVRLLSLRDGKEVSRLQTPDYSVVTIREKRLYASTSQPFPRVLIFHYEPSPGHR